MPIRKQKWITRQNLKDNPETLYVFGDNLMRAGLGGQAKAMRGEPNAVGIPTKLTPAMDYGAFFRDEHYDLFMEESAKEIIQLATHLAAGGEVVVPADGIGTGLACLEETSPRIFNEVEFILSEGIVPVEGE